MAEHRACQIKISPKRSIQLHSRDREKQAARHHHAHHAHYTNTHRGMHMHVCSAAAVALVRGAITVGPQQGGAAGGVPAAPGADAVGERSLPAPGRQQLAPVRGRPAPGATVAPGRRRGRRRRRSRQLLHRAVHPRHVAAPQAPGQALLALLFRGLGSVG